MNKFICTGRLTRDPEKRTTQSGKSVTTFTVAVDRRFKQNGERVADFFSVVCWEGRADYVAEYIRKGQLVEVVGEIQTRSYEKDGAKRYTFEVNADEIKPLSSNNSGGQSAPDARDMTPTDDSDLPF